MKIFRFDHALLRFNYPLVKIIQLTIISKT